MFWAEVKYIMLCMDLWREGEYPVDKLLPMAAGGVSQGFQAIDFSNRKNERIKNYYQVKSFIKKMYREPGR